MQLVFLHVPKTGGSSVNHILRQMFFGARTATVGPFQKYSEAEFRALSSSKREEFHIVRGIVDYSISSHTSQDAKYMTIVRDPVERLVSHYKYVTRTPTHYLYSAAVDANLSLQDYILSDLSPELLDGQARQILANEYHPELSEEEVVRILKTRFDFIGTTKSIPDAIAWVSATFGRPLPVSVQQKNVSPGSAAKTELDSSIREAVGQRNRVDGFIYNHALREMAATSTSRSAIPAQSGLKWAKGMPMRIWQDWVR